MCVENLITMVVKLRTHQVRVIQDFFATTIMSRMPITILLDFDVAGRSGIEDDASLNVPSGDDKSECAEEDDDISVDVDSSARTAECCMM